MRAKGGRMNGSAGKGQGGCERGERMIKSFRAVCGWSGWGAGVAELGGKSVSVVVRVASGWSEAMMMMKPRR